MKEAKGSIARLPNVTLAGTKKKKRTETAVTDENALRTMLSQYGSLLSAADRQYDAAAERLDAERAESERRAAVDRVLLGKYASTRDADASLGVRTSADAIATNDFRRAVGEAERTYADALGKLGEQREKTRSDLLRFYGEQVRGDQDKLYDKTLKRITEEDWFGYAGLRTLLENVRAHLRPEQMAHLDNVASYYFANKGYK